MPNPAEWLSLVREPALEPALPICDPHHHLWERPGDPYRLADLQADLASGHNIVSTVFIECNAFNRTSGPEALRPVGETEFVVRETAPAAGGPVRVAEAIVAHANLALGAAVDEVLEAHLAAGQGRVRGIRHGVAWDVSPGIASYRNQPPGRYLDPRYREGVSRLKKYGLSLDTWQYHPQLAELVLLARDNPDTTIIIDHCGAPLALGPWADWREQATWQWRGALQRLAELPNTVVKVGGLGQPNANLGMPQRPTPPNSQELAAILEPWVRYVIDTFGPARCMFESNFPVDKMSFSYGVMWNAFKRLSACYSPSERADLFYGTAARVYRLCADPCPSADR
ncbi:MAG: amidohydrolase family protein [Anaerolineae bacterium]|jgi:L-fuconolactonase|nr:amidohydrolase family protein [Chloroflexota bacterium]